MEAPNAVTSRTDSLPRPGDRQKVAIAVLLLCTLLWSLAGVGLKYLFGHTHLTATALGGYRALFAGLSLLPLALRRGGLRPARLRPLAWLAVAAVMFCPMIWTFVASVGRTTSANAIILMYTAPLWVLLLAPWLTGDRAAARLVGGCDRHGWHGDDRAGAGAGRCSSRPARS